MWVLTDSPPPLYSPPRIAWLNSRSVRLEIQTITELRFRLDLSYIHIILYFETRIAVCNYLLLRYKKIFFYYNDTIYINFYYSIVN